MEGAACLLKMMFKKRRLGRGRLVELKLRPAASGGRNPTIKTRDVAKEVVGFCADYELSKKTNIRAALYPTYK